MLADLGYIQIPVLAIMLLGGCTAKVARAIRQRSISAGLGPTALFPLKLRPLAAGTLCAVELGLGVGLIVTVGGLGNVLTDRLFRFGTVLLFVVATFALIELRSVRPDIGCGCFGEFSSTPITGRTLARSILLAIAALSAVYVPPIEPPRQISDVVPILVFLVVELGIIGALSPEVRD